MAQRTNTGCLLGAFGVTFFYYFKDTTNASAQNQSLGIG
jgi:hypothetical protein